MRGDYSNGRIYFIEPICEHEDNEFYYGSTIQKLCKRMDKHRRDFKYWKDGKRTKITCFDLFEKYGLENCKIFLVELYPCKSREELESREGYYIRNYDCVNKNIPGRKHTEYMKEYRINNKDEIKEYMKKYHIDNKEYFTEYYYDNKDKILKHNREYNKKNKESIQIKQCIKIECPCSGKYTRHNKSIHIKTKKHIKYIEQNNNQEI